MLADGQTYRVSVNITLDTLSVIVHVTVPANHLACNRKQNQNKLQHNNVYNTQIKNYCN